ncbi:MAG: HDOD domain-containing protein [Spirochaetales bacterium]|nr:HDOD domain-containing protein [Spirochaetales bacterium]
MSSASINQIQMAIAKSSPITFKTYNLDHSTFTKLDQILEIILNELGEEKIQSQVSYCLHEIAENAKKANLKRVYFDEIGLSMKHPEEYQKGMEGFKEEVYSNIEKYQQRLEEKQLYTKISFHASMHSFVLSVVNNAEITEHEIRRIDERKAKARAYKTMEEAFEQVLDCSEGAGLGIVIMILMLKKIGLNEGSFEVKALNGLTEARIMIPRSNILLENMEPLVQKIVGEIDILPTIPEHILQLKKLVSNPDADFNSIANYVSMDPGLTAELLKVVNSAQYMLQRKVDKVNEAVTLIGFRGLKNLLYSYGSQKVMQEKYGEMKSLWQHCYKVAFYGFQIAKDHHFKEIIDDIFVASLLHDLGKVVVEFLHPELMEHIKTFSTERGLTAEMFEKFSIGMHHAEIGARVAEHWNFPEPLITAIRFHHDPNQGPEEFKHLIQVVYLANSFANIEDSEFIFEQMDPTVLMDFNLDEIDFFENYHEKLKSSYKKNSGLKP